MQGIRLDENALEIQLAEQLPKFRPLMVFAGGVAGLDDGYAQRYRIQRLLDDEC
jgi:hypothetical protein